MIFERVRIKYCNHAMLKRATSTSWALLGLAGPTFLQLIYIVAAARLLGAEVTGNFFLIVSVAVIASSFVGLGSGGLVMRDAARDRSRATTAFGRAQAMSLATFPFMMPLVVAGGWYFTKGQIPIWVILAISISDLLAARMLTTSWSLFIALEEQVRGSLVVCLMPLARLFAVLITFLIPIEARLSTFSILYFATSFIVIAGVLLYVRVRIGSSPLSLSGFDYLDGISFSATWLNAALQTESDKLLLGLFANPVAVAVYSVGSRLMDGAAMPPRALKVTFQSRLFREGASGHWATYRLTLRLLPITVAYGFAVWLAFWLAAPLLAWLFGSEFQTLQTILPMLGALPLVRAISDYGAEIFLASDKPAIQALTQTFATALRIGMGVLLIAGYGLHGAVFTAIGVNAISAVVLWGLAWSMSRRVVEIAETRSPR